MLSTSSGRHRASAACASCVAVAGPVVVQRQLTNLPWTLSETARTPQAGSTGMVNDFAVLIHGCHISIKSSKPLQAAKTNNPSPEDSRGPVAILGAGTGLGMARGIPDANGWIALASEGGHREFAPRTDDEWHLASWLKADLDLDRLSIERIVSGTGLGHVMRWRLQRSDGAGHPLLRAAEAWRTRAVDEDDYQDLPALVGQAAQQGDALARSALDLWLGAYGSTAGDLALQELCTGGLWIGGGTAAKQRNGLQSATFLEPMRRKGRFRPLIESITVKAVIDPTAGLFSAACRAHVTRQPG